MKIISKFKDNYDFMVSKYGLDETLVYDRGNSILVDADELWRLNEGDKKEFERDRRAPLYRRQIYKLEQN